jgi:hypothetical protein
MDNSLGNRSLTEWRYFCRGCGLKLPLGFRGHFHRGCLRADKRRRTSKRHCNGGWKEHFVRIAALDTALHNLMERQGHPVKLHSPLRNAINL